MYKTDKQEGPTVQHRELYSLFLITYKRKASEKEYIYTYICIYESLCCTPETNNIVNQLYFNNK